MKNEELIKIIACLNSIDEKEAAGYVLYFVQNYPLSSTTEILEIIHDVVTSSAATVEGFYKFCKKLKELPFQDVLYVHSEMTKKLANMGVSPNADIVKIVNELKW